MFKRSFKPFICSFALSNMAVASFSILDSKEIIMISEISNVTPKKIITNEIEKSENKVIYVSYPIEDETYNKNDEKENQTIVDNDKQDNQDNQEDNKVLISNVIKIVIIVTLTVNF